MLYSSNLLLISIHASKKEATNSNIISVQPFLFQSTPPRRRRLAQNVIGCFHFDFNPRLQEGGDLLLCFLQVLFCLFQSTPPRRRRRSFTVAEYSSITISIHASKKEATFRHTTFYKTKEFQSTPPRRRRRDTASRSRR